MNSTKTRHRSYGWGALFAALAILALPTRAHAQATLISGLGGTAGFGTNVVATGDDNSSAAIDLTPYDLQGLCFFGSSHTTMYINNNGNITFNAPVGGYTPNPFPASTNPMIAPWWGDVYTLNAVATPVGANRVYWDIRQVGGLGQLVVTWFDVGYYAAADKLNTFQLVIRETSASSGTTPADYTVEFRYAQLQWTTGNASGGTDGLGGTPAQAGFDAGDFIHYSQLPGSRTAGVLNLLTTSNTTPAQPGLWQFNFHSCQIACTSNAQCAGPTPICDGTTHTCRPCSANADCSAPTPVCDTTAGDANVGRCVQCTAGAQCTTGMCTANACTCTTNANCPSGTPICDTGAHTCRACNPSVATDCTGTTPVCGATGNCVQCAPGLTAACVAPTLACSPAGSCVQCAPGMTTACTGTTPFCDPTTFHCVGCTPANQATVCTSAAAPYCETIGPTAGTCVAATTTVVLPASGSTTINMQPAITGTAPPGSTVVIYIDGMQVGTTVATAAGTYSFTPPSALSVGMHTATAAIQIGSGTGPLSAGDTFTVAQCILNTDCPSGSMFCDTTAHLCRGCLTNANCSGSAPTCDSTSHSCRACMVAADCTDPLAPVCTTAGPMAGSCVAATATVVTPAAGSISANPTPTVSGTAPAGSTVVIYIDGVQVGTTTADASGNYSFTVPTPVGVGVHLATAAVQVGATTGPQSAPNGFTIVQCQASTDCTGATPVCNTTMNVCVGCNSSADCSGTTPVCDPATSVCRGCLLDVECTGATPACLATTGACVQCTSSMSTLCTGTTPACDPSSNTCVLCTPGTGPAAACATDPNGTACEQPSTSMPAFCGCGTDADCGNATSGRICDTTMNRCTDGCLPGTGHNGCPTGQFCTSDTAGTPGLCTTTCNFDSDCASMTSSPHCLTAADGGTSQCVQCINDSQCAGRTDPRVLCIGANNTCAQCNATSHGMCTASGVGSACLTSGLCGCTTDTDCASDRMCNVATNQCVTRQSPDAGTDGGVQDGGVQDAGVRDASMEAGHDAGRDGATTDGRVGDGSSAPSITGGGDCSCRVPGAPTGGSSKGSFAGVVAGLAAAFASRRRRRSAI